MGKKSNIIIALTVAESKRIIAKGIYKLLKPSIKKITISIPKGTTNGYIAEEFLGKSIDKASYLIGNIFPAKKDRSKYLKKEIINDVVIKKGEILDCSAISAVKEMKKGDVFIKGANCLNLKKKTAGVLVGSLAGGTIGAVQDRINKEKIRLIIPVGLEKCCFQPINKIIRILNSNEAIYDENRLWMRKIKGEIITEIEALKILTNVKVTHIASGGIGGAEGAIILYIEGEPDNIKKTRRLLNLIQGEDPLIK